MSKVIIEGADGIPMTSTGLIAVQEQADFVAEVISGKASDLARGYRLIMTLNHEATHFIQCFTAAFPYSFSLRLLQLARQLMDAGRSEDLTPRVADQFRDAFRDCSRRYALPHRGLDTFDLRGNRMWRLGR